MPEMTLPPYWEDALDDLLREWDRVGFEAPYWFAEDADSEYCNSCATAIAQEKGWQKDGGWEWETDAPVFCARCEAPLDYTLTDYGAEQELEHFEAHGVDPDSDLDRYSLARIGGGVPTQHAERLYRLLFAAPKPDNLSHSRSNE